MTIAGSFAKSGHPLPEGRAFDALSTQPVLPLRHWNCGPLRVGCSGEAGFAAEGNLAAWFQGRLDNRNELKREFVTATGDASLLLAAYSKWGLDFLDHFAGDFCCALWDGREGRLLLGRDALGRMPLVYHDAHDAFYFACEPQELLALAGIAREIDEETLAEWLAKQPRPQTRTFHQGISRVPPGHVLVVETKGLRLHRYWRPEEKPLLRFHRDEDYAEALLESLEQAVSCRLPAEGQVACMLSAGLDSTSVTALAARQLAKQGRTLVAFTAVPQAGFDASRHYPKRLCDEGPLAARVASMYPNIDHVLIPNNAHPLLAAIKDGVRINESPLLGGSNVTWCNAVQEEAQRRGARVLFTGAAGNFTISYDGMLLLPSLLERGKLLSLGGELLRLRHSGVSWGSLGMKTIGPFLPIALREGIRRAMGKDGEFGLYEYSCINPNFARESGVEQRFMRHGFIANLANPADGLELRQRMFRMVDGGIAIAGMNRFYGYPNCDPTADKRLIELCLSIPEEQYLRNGEPRSLIRRAMKGILPDEILSNRRRGMQSADLLMNLEPQLPDLLSELERLEASPLASRYLDLPRMRKLLEALSEADWKLAKVKIQYGGVVRSLAAGVFIRLTEQGA